MDNSITPAYRFKSLVKFSSFILIIVFVFFSGLELLLALFGVRPIVSSEDPLVGFSGNIPLFVETVQADGTMMMQTAENKLDLFNDQSFPIIKANNTYRIFCMGGSTTVGRPYVDSTSFCGWLRVFLKTVDPSRNWEVINAGGVSYASYRVSRLMNELVQYNPDLFIVYSGQNEFLEQRSYGDLKKIPDWLLYTDSLLAKTRTYTAVKGVIDKINHFAPENVAQQQNQLSSEVDEILKHTRGPTSYHRDNKLKQQIIEHYRLNLIRMTQIARQASAEIIFVNPIANLKDMSPFKSEHKEGLTDEVIAKWEALYQLANKSYSDGDYTEAINIYQQALVIDDSYAELHYRLGRAQFSLGDFDAAEASFLRALNEDIAPLRILTEMRRIVADVASSYEVPLIDFKTIIKDAYKKDYNHTIFGKEYFLDHVHPTIVGYRLLGLSLLDKLIQQGIVASTIPLSEEKIIQITQEIYSKIDKNDQRVALTKLGRVLDWAGKFDESYNLFTMSLKLFGPHAFTYGMLGKTAYRAGMNDQAIKDLRKSVSMNPDLAWVQSLLGQLLKEKGETDAAIKHFLEAIRIEADNYTAHEKVAMLLTSKGDYEAAAHHFSETLRINPDDGVTILNFTVFLVKAERDEEAMSWAQKLLERNSYQAQAHNIMGVLFAKKGQSSQAIDHFREALKIKPDLVSAKTNLDKAEAAQDSKTN